MELGAFSVSLVVKDIATSRSFYEALGFTQLGGNQEHGWLILTNGTTVIGLFHGMFERNMLTFNPGWRSDCSELESFTDVRELERRLVAAGIAITASNTHDSASGPAYISLVDPDGNPILIDQHR